MNARRRIHRLPFSLATTLFLALPAVGTAQAWNADKGSTSFTISYGNNWATKHYTYLGDEVDRGHTRSQVVAFGVSRALTDRLSASLSVPYVQSKYMGSFPHTGSEVDDGDYHGTFQDLNVSLRYQLSEDPVAFTPFVAYGLPIRDYVTLGHAAPGQRLDVYTLGFFTGASLDDWLPNTYVQGSYGYSFVEKVAGISHDRSRAGLEVGYFLTPTLGVRALGSWQKAHGGLDISPSLPAALFPYHDQASAESYVSAGLGVFLFADPSGGPLRDVRPYLARPQRAQNGRWLDLGSQLQLPLRLSPGGGSHAADEPPQPLKPRW